MSVDDDDLETITNTIIFLIELRNKFYKSFKDDLDNFNFKKTRVDNIISNEGNLEVCFNNIINLHDEICKSAHDEITLGSELNITQARVKEQKSILGKLHRFRNAKEKGKISLYKCLNDLLGVRIICDNLCIEDFEILKSLIEQKFSSDKIMIKDSSKNGYIGLHIYFILSRKRILPWELQIWPLTCLDSNERSHEVYKKYHKKF